jgi:hypothetical protein
MISLNKLSVQHSKRQTLMVNASMSSSANDINGQHNLRY